MTCSKPPTDADPGLRRRRAYHEAGHAVAYAVTLGSGVVEFVAIPPSPLLRSGEEADAPPPEGATFGGLTKIMNGMRCRSPGDAQGVLVSIYAGVAASCAFVHHAPWAEAWRTEGSGDQANAEELLSAFVVSSDAGRDVVEAAIVERATELVTEFDDAVHAVARLLMERSEIRADEFARLMKAHGIE